MYLEHFGLKELPFSIIPNPQFFLNLPGHHEALNTLLVGLRSGEGFIKIVGEVGAGKTLLCRKLIQILSQDKSFFLAYMVNPNLSVDGLYHALASALKLRIPQNFKHQRILKLINERLLRLHRSKKRVIFIVDEAQALPLESLEGIRLLTNLETETEKLMQVVLVGQPELDETLNQRNLRQLKQRITFSYRLIPMNQREIREYIQHRLKVAGYVGEPLFSRASMDQIYASSGGMPRLVNILAHKSLMMVYGRGGRRVELKDAQMAILDTEYAEQYQHPWWSKVLSWFKTKKKRESLV